MVFYRERPFAKGDEKQGVVLALMFHYVYVGTDRAPFKSVSEFYSSIQKYHILSLYNVTGMYDRAEHVVFDN